jgi:MOSC domain-containing protein YiiM
MNGMGIVISIYIAPAAGAPMQSVAKIQAKAGRGLEGDRYCNRLGTFSGEPGTGREITLIEIEAIEALKRDYQIELEAELTRRNLVTRGVPLNHLVNREFNVGAVTLRGTRLCEPCLHMEKLTRKGVMSGLIHRGGLRADIAIEGVIHVGDIITVDGAEP